MLPQLKLPVFIKHLKVRRHAQARHLKLHIDPLHKIPVLTVPKRCNKGRMEAFLQESREWLEQNYHPSSFDQEVNLPEVLRIKGMPYTLSWQEEGKTGVNEDIVNQHLAVQAPKDIQNIILTRYLKARALVEAKQLIRYYADQLGVKVHKIDVKEYKARWGCCYKRGDIFVSWRLILAPFEVFQYVCAHEVTHLVYHDHSPQFWAVLESIFPTYKEGAKWLKQEGRSLFDMI
jgi:predicted metal-dependent hydrolase